MKKQQLLKIRNKIALMHREVSVAESSDTFRELYIQDFSYLSDLSFELMATDLGTKELTAFDDKLDVMEREVDYNTSADTRILAPYEEAFSLITKIIGDGCQLKDFEPREDLQ